MQGDSKLPFVADLKGKTAVVTGAGGVLCAGFAGTLASCGASVAVLDINLDAARKTADEINASALVQKSSGRAKAYKADVLDKKSLEDVYREIQSDLGETDILINGAGGNHPRGTTTMEYHDPKLTGTTESVRTFFDLDADSIRFVFELNFLGTLIPSQVFSAGMATRKKGTIINISSMNAIRPLTKIPAYSGAKAAVTNFTLWLSVHFARVGIRVNAIAPGFFLTAQNHSLLVNPDGEFNERARKILEHTPMSRFGVPEDLTGTLLYLADEKASGFVNGIVIPVDGGFSAYSGV